MTTTLRFHPNVEKDLASIYRWYENKVVGLGEAFLDIFYSSCDNILNFPLSSPQIYNKFHRFLMKKFPYAIYYQILNSEVIIFGLFHHSQNPRYIHKNLKRK